MTVAGGMPTGKPAGLFLIGARLTLRRKIEFRGEWGICRPRRRSASVIADRFHGTAFHRFLAKLLLFGSRRLLVNVGVAAIIIAAKVARGGLAAQITVDTLVIDIKLACEVFGIAVCDVSHNILEIQAYTA